MSICVTTGKYRPGTPRLLAASERLGADLAACAGNVPAKLQLHAAMFGAIGKRVGGHLEFIADQDFEPGRDWELTPVAIFKGGYSVELDVPLLPGQQVMDRTTGAPLGTTRDITAMAGWLEREMHRQHDTALWELSYSGSGRSLGANP